MVCLSIRVIIAYFVLLRNVLMVYRLRIGCISDNFCCYIKILYKWKTQRFSIYILILYEIITATEKVLGQQLYITIQQDAPPILHLLYNSIIRSHLFITCESCEAIITVLPSLFRFSISPMIISLFF